MKLGRISLSGSFEVSIEPSTSCYRTISDFLAGSTARNSDKRLARLAAAQEAPRVAPARSLHSQPAGSS